MNPPEMERPDAVIEFYHAEFMPGGRRYSEAHNRLLALGAALAQGTRAGKDSL